MPVRNGHSDFRIKRKDLKIAPIERSETIPSAWYTGQPFHEMEKQYLFRNTWQYAGHISQLPGPGDYLLTTVADNPVIVIHGKDGIIRAFFNVCRHRGGPLAIEPSGSCNVLQCNYHGWTYLLDGSLRGTPKFNRTELFDKKDFGLVPVDMEIWEGLLFVNLTKSRLPVASIMKGIAERIAPFSFHHRKFYKRISYEVQCNWKVYVDNYLEGYHLPFVHPELCNLLDYQNYITETFEYYSLQYSPLTEKENVYGANGGEALYYFVFPNFMMNILPGRLQTNLVLPIRPNACSVIFDYYYDDPTSTEALERAESDIKYSDTIQQEDIEICEYVQRGLESIAYDKGRFSPEMEQGVYHFQCLLKKTYNKYFHAKP